MKRKVAILRHADLDGFGAAYAAWEALNDSCELLFISVQYPQDPPYEALKEFAPDKVFILDFSYKADVLEDLSQDHDIMVIDHHVTAEAHLSAWLNVEIGSNQPLPTILYEGKTERGAILDTTQSGAVLAWKFFCGMDVPPILQYVQDDDLWKFELENSREITAFIHSMPKDFEEWAMFDLPEAYDGGKAMLRFKERLVKGRLKDVKFLEYGKMRFSNKYTFRSPSKYISYEEAPLIIPAVNATDNISDVGEMLCKEFPNSPFSMSFCCRGDGTISHSLRSNSGFDVSEVAKQFGGGGHKAAAGFTTKSEIFHE